MYPWKSFFTNVWFIVFLLSIGLLGLLGLLVVRSSIHNRAHLHTAPPCFGRCTAPSRGSTRPRTGTHAPRSCAQRRSPQLVPRPRWQAPWPCLLSTGPRCPTGMPDMLQATSGLAYASCPALVLRQCHTCGRLLCIYWSWYFPFVVCLLHLWADFHIGNASVVLPLVEEILLE